MAAGIVTTSDAEFEQLIEGNSDAVREIARAARSQIVELHPEVVEVVWLTQGNAGYGIGPKKMSEQYAWILPAAKHVALAFPAGAFLDDPVGLLQGTGKSIRNVRLSSVDDVGRPELRRLIEQSVARLTDGR